MPPLARWILPSLVEMPIQGGAITIADELPWLHPSYGTLLCSVGQNRNYQSYANLLPDPGDQVSLLELGCGTGGLLLPLARLGFDASGVDGNPNLLNQLRTAARAEGLNIPITCDRVESVSIAQEFSAIILDSAIINSGPFPFRDALISNISRHLRPGGCALIEYCDPDFLERTEELIDPLQEIHRDTIEIQDHERVWKGQITYKIPHPHIAVLTRFHILSLDQLTEEFCRYGLYSPGVSLALNPVTRLLRLVKSSVKED